MQPTVFADVENKHTIGQEEIFGPALSMIPYADEDQAVALADDSDFGLGGSVWTTDGERGEAVARRVVSGTIGINRYVNDRPRPSAWSRPAGSAASPGPEGLHGYQMLKTIYLDASS
ncbi:aldehyde dehydrogenase family protein [Pseudonocardia kujensis]|uniref:aldehyde dehydrogenase family protein n=1 Tax=Pseudonocardia kujensis TaxID=1128675 RepID=UPI0027E06868|nr:aldehyde dehydrogenase family protein [Pseudonocardia kujensis]